MYLGWVGLLVLPGIVNGGGVHRPRAAPARGRGRGLAIAAGVGVFVVLDLVAYFVGITRMLDARREQFERERLEGVEQAREPGPSRQGP